MIEVKDMILDIPTSSLIDYGASYSYINPKQQVVKILNGTTGNGREKEDYINDTNL